MRADLRREAKALEAKLAGDARPADKSPVPQYGIRAYLVDNAQMAGTTLASLEQRYAESRLSVQRVERGGRFLPIASTLTFDRGDRVVVSAGRRALALAGESIGPEVDDPALLAVPVKTATAVVTNKEVHGRSLGELGREPNARGVYLQSLQRGTELMPREAWTIVERGDMLHIVGAPEDLERVARHIGYIERDISATDLTFLAAGVCAGILLGMLKLNAAGIVLGLGTAGSILVVGLVGGWARSRYPVFGAIPEPAQRLLMDIGLIVFIAVVGLHAGPHAVDAYRASGGAFFAKIFLAGVIVTTVPLAVGTVMARYVLKLSPLMSLGGLAGAQTCTPGLTALREASDSNVGSLAYTVPYAIGNILLTIWGPVVVAIVFAMRG